MHEQLTLWPPERRVRMDRDERYPGDLYNGKAPHQRTDTSREAAEAIEPRVTTLHAKLLEFLGGRREVGATDHEIAAALGWPLQTAVPRRSEMVTRGMVADSGRQRLTPYGRKAIVWVIRKRQCDLMGTHGSADCADEKVE